jgi:HEAT repeat protein
MLRLDQPTQVRAAAALALGRIHDRIAVGALGEALQDPASEVRYAAALSLGRLPADGVATRLSRVLKGDPSWQVRYAAAIALGRTQKKFVGPDLADALVYDPSWQVRQQAARSLQEIGTPLAVDTLSAALHDVDPSVRAAAGTSLGELPDAEGHRAIAEALREEKDPSVRRILTLAARRAVSR